MNIDTAKKIASSLVRNARGKDGAPLAKMHAYVEGDRIVFTGGAHGEHTLCLDVSDEARVLAHWEGYIEANGASARPVVGQRVEFESASAWRSYGSYRRGTVLSVGPKRAKIGYHFKHGGYAETTVHFAKMRF